MMDAFPLNGKLAKAVTLTDWRRMSLFFYKARRVSLEVSCQGASQKRPLLTVADRQLSRPLTHPAGPCLYLTVSKWVPVPPQPSQRRLQHVHPLFEEEKRSTLTFATGNIFEFAAVSVRLLAA